MVAHSTKRGAKDTAVEVDKVGDTGLKRTEGTVKQIDRGGKRLVIESADGTEHAFTLTRHAAADAGKDVAAGGEKAQRLPSIPQRMQARASRTSSRRFRNEVAAESS